MGYAPKVIGIDFNFWNTRSLESDSLLKNVFNNENIVVSCILKNQIKDHLFEQKQSSFFVEEAEKLQEGFTNLSSGMSDDYIRSFYPVATYENNGHIDSIYSFASTIAIKFNPALKEKIIYPNFHNKTINFSQTTFNEIEYTDIQQYKDEIKNKIVLVGCVGCSDDVIATLYDENLSGIQIHAHILSTIIHNKYIEKSNMGIWLTILLYLFLTLFYLKAFYFAKTKALITVIFRITQIVTTFTTLIAGYYLFLKHSININIYVSSLILVGIVTDFSYGLIRLFQKFLKINIQKG